MKTRKQVLIPLLLIALLFSYAGIAQEEEKESYNMAMIVYMYAKIGMESDFETAVKQHNDAFHKEGKYKGYLDYIMSGNEAGWYVWSMGPCTFTDLDNAPGEGAHADDWKNNVAPKIKKYGRQEYWKNNKKLSYQSDDEDKLYSNLWFIDLKRGDYYRFKALVSKVKEAFEKKGKGSMIIYNNQFIEDDGRDVAIVWRYNNLAELDDDDSIKKEYEEINGEGSWNNMLDEWEEITISINSQLWKEVTK